jgi:hypothetical protein
VFRILLSMNSHPTRANAKRAVCRLVAVGLLLGPLGAVPSNAASVVRRPYLQLATPDSIVVRWRTDVPTATTLRYGTSPADLSQVLTTPTPTTEHEVAVTSLTPGTRYYYSVGTPDSVLESGPTHHFSTAPPHGSAESTRIWVIGDSGSNTFKSTEVTDAYLAFAGANLADLWLMLGDNAYPEGTDAQYTWAVFDNYPQILRNTTLWPTPGNHDFSFLNPESSDAVTETGPYYDSFTLPTLGEAGGAPSGTETYYSFDRANIHFASIDVYRSDLSVGGAMHSWLIADLAATTQEWIIVFLHFPPYSAGSRDSDTDTHMRNVRMIFAPIFEDFGVDLVLTGHSHTYERSVLIDGHYGTKDTLTSAHLIDPGDGNPAGDGAYRKPAFGVTPHSGTVYVVNGVGENAHADGGPLDHPVMAVSEEIEGSMVIDVHQNLLEAHFISRFGDVLDRFQIIKGVVPVPASSAPLLFALAAGLAAAGVAFARRRT